MSVNYLAVLVATLAVFIIGWLWYSPMLFGNLWLRLSKVSQKDITKAKNKGMTHLIISGFIATLVTALVFEYLLDMFGITDMYTGILLSLLLWIGFLVTSMLNSVLWEGKPFSVYVINIFHQLVCMIVMGAILTAW